MMRRAQFFAKTLETLNNMGVYLLNIKRVFNEGTFGPREEEEGRGYGRRGEPQTDRYIDRQADT